MQNKINIIQPDIIAEQIFSYSIQSYEALKSIKRETKSKYTFTLIPDGSHIYTGILQTTWYLLLDSDKKNIIIISSQNNNPDKIEIYNKTIWPILWLYFDWLDFPSKSKKYTHTKDFPSELEFQLNIARIIKDTKNYMYIGIWSNITDKDIQNLSKSLEKYNNDCNFVFLTNLSEDIEIKKCKNIDKKIIEDLSMRKNENTYTKDNIILNTFIYFSKKLNTFPEIVMYANSGDIDWKTKKTNWYVCMVF